MGELRRGLLSHLEVCNPDHILMPFRYDRHPDHLAVNRVITSAHAEGLVRAELTEYFVYHRWRLLPRRDVRKYLHPQYLFEIDIEGVAERKRDALACFVSQTTRFYSWQTRPILTPELLDDECARPEQFLMFDPRVRGARVFSRATAWIRIVHRVEPILQKWKYLLKSTLLRAFRRNDDSST